jgi:hypothetical protein
MILGSTLTHTHQHRYPPSQTATSSMNWAANPPTYSTVLYCTIHPKREIKKQQISRLQTHFPVSPKQDWEDLGGTRAGTCRGHKKVRIVQNVEDLLFVPIADPGEVDRQGCVKGRLRGKCTVNAIRKRGPNVCPHTL